MQSQPTSQKNISLVTLVTSGRSTYEEAVNYFDKRLRSHTKV